MRKLHLMRHAKAGRDDPALQDIDRRITPRGLQDAMAIAEWMGRTGIRPTLVLCSSARRTRETLGLLLPYLTPMPEVLVEPDLYLAPLGLLLDRFRGLPATVSEVLLVGHNDGLHEAAVTLAGEGEEAMLMAMRRKFSPATVASLCFTGDWAAIRAGAGRLEALMTPAELRCD